MPESNHNPNIAPTPAKQKFSGGTLVATPGALALLNDHAVSPLSLLTRHLAGDWGDVPPEDAQMNEMALRHGGRLLSAYRIGRDARIWIITESDRSSSTVLRPEEY